MNDGMGYIKLWRKFTSWEWHDNPNVVTLFIHCLLMANWEDKRWQGVEIKRGEFATTYKHLSDITGLTIQQVRTALKKLEDSGEVVTNKKRGRSHTFIRVCKYEDYQDQQINNTLITNNQQINNKKITTTKEDKEVKKNKKHIYGEYKNVRLTDSELDKLKEEFGTKTADDCITYLDEYIEMKGTKYKSHYLAIRKWVVDAVKKTNTQKKQTNKFNNFSGRSYSNEELEKLLGG